MPRGARLLAAIALSAAPVAAQTVRVFDFPGGRAERVVVFASEPPVDAKPPALPSSPMLLRLQGIAAIVDGEEPLRRLNACIVPSEKRNEPEYAGQVPGTTRLWLLQSSRVGDSARIEILQTAYTSLAAHPLDPTGKPTPLVPLRTDRFAEASASWSVYRGSLPLSPPPAEPGPTPPAALDFAKPLVAGRFMLDRPTISERFTRGLQSTLPPTERNLGNETMHVRLPRGYDPRSPAGLLVWISASPDGHPPDAFARALDELGLIAIGPSNCGNNRPAADRYQLALDAVASASARYHIDQRRVYISGISGGGRISSIMQGCFPDVFTGSVPIVGLSIYEKVQLPAPEIGKFVRPAYQRPDARRFAQLRTRPIAAITGAHDMNCGEITESVRLLARDGVNAKLYSYDDMGHELPGPDRFLEAIQWVDETYQELRRKESEQAQKLLDTYTAQLGQAAPADAIQRRALVRITEVGPWTPAAWKAAAMLLPSSSPPTAAPAP